MLKRLFAPNNYRTVFLTERSFAPVTILCSVDGLVKSIVQVAGNVNALLLWNRNKLLR